MHKLIDAAFAVFSLLPIRTQMKLCDRYQDRSVVVVACFGMAAAYVRTPDGQITSQWQKGDLKAARRFGYAMREIEFGRWVQRAASDELLTVRDEEVASNLPDLSLISFIQRELDMRMGFDFRKAA